MRTELKTVLESAAKALAFDDVGFGRFDMYLLGWPNAASDLPADLLALVEPRYAAMRQSRHKNNLGMLMRGLRGGTGHYDSGDFRALCARHQTMGTDDFPQILVLFLERVAETREAQGARLALHPDDPPIAL